VYALRFGARPTAAMAARFSRAPSSYATIAALIDGSVVVSRMPTGVSWIDTSTLNALGAAVYPPLSYWPCPSENPLTPSNAYRCSVFTKSRPALPTRINTDST